MAKKRVHEIAKELGYTSKEVLAQLQEMGEFVKAASSSIEPPTEKKLRAAMPAKTSSDAASVDEKTSDEQKRPKPAPRKKATPTLADINDLNLDTLDPELRQEAERLRAQLRMEEESSDESEEVERPAMPKPRAPRPPGGNNPFSSGETGAPVEGERTGGPRPRAFPKPAAPRASGARPTPGRGGRTANRVNDANRDSGIAQGGGARPKPGQAGNTGSNAGNPGRRSAPAAGGFGKSSRGRGGTQGAFGRGVTNKKQRKSKRAKRQEFEHMEAPVVGGVSVIKGDGSTPLRLTAGATIADLAEKINADPAALITVLFHLGEMATATQSLDEDTFALLGAELGYDVQVVSPEEEDKELLESFDIDFDDAETDDNAGPRAPVVTVMGHVDHGKTRLLDAIRKTNVIEDEHGGITQHIGAYQIDHDQEGTNRPLTFIDTPGHEAFTAMRARGAKVTDVAILVVAADDGVMPQTVEALNHAQAAGVPIVVAINKIDTEGANPEKVKGQLVEYGLVPEEYGGDTMFVEISARQGENIDELLESVLLTTDAALDLKANPDKQAKGVAIEAHLDKGRGAVATVLVQSGTLKVGQPVVVGTAFGRVRAMFDDEGNSVEEALPSAPVQVLGLSEVPRAGDGFLVAEERVSRQIAEKRAAAERNAMLAKRRKRVSLEALNDAIAEGKLDTLNLILKGDASGAVEALEDALLQIDVGDGVGLRVIHRGVGAITQNDVNLATVDTAVVIGFNVRPAERVADLAEREGVDMRFYNVIYSAIDDIEASLKGMLKPEYEERVEGSAEVREIFRSSKFGNIGGCLVQSGTIKRNAKARIVREGLVIGEGLSIATLRRFKDDATEVREGYECGIGLGDFNDIREGDNIETYDIVEIPRN